VLTETPLKVKAALRRLTEIATLTEQIQSEPHLPIVRRSPSFPKVGTARRAVRLLHGRGAQASRLCMAESGATSSAGLVLHCSTRPRRPCPILKQQGRLRRESGTPVARHPYPFLSKGAAVGISDLFGQSRRFVIPMFSRQKFSQNKLDDCPSALKNAHLLSPMNLHLEPQEPFFLLPLRTSGVFVQRLRSRFWRAFQRYAK